MNRFSPDELRRAVEGLEIIERDGDGDEWAVRLREAMDSSPAADAWDNVPIGARIKGGILARRLAGLLDAPVEDCERAAAEVYGRDRRRAVYDAILSYAAALSGRSASASPAAPAPTPMAAPVTVRIKKRRAG